MIVNLILIVPTIAKQFAINLQQRLGISIYIIKKNIRKQATQKTNHLNSVSDLLFKFLFLDNDFFVI